MKNYVQDGDRLTFVAGATTASGAGVKIGVRLGVAAGDVANGATGVAAMEGVYNLPKLSTDVVTKGALLYWDDTNKRVTLTASSHIVAGYAFTDAGNGVATVDVNINR